jgi:arylsulfatase A-like enzyme
LAANSSAARSGRIAAAEVEARSSYRYSTYEDGKFLTTWSRTSLPPCFTHSTVMWGGYNNVQVKVDGVSRTATGYSITYLGVRGREYIQQALSLNKPFLLYETPQAPHEVDVTNPDGTISKLSVPETKYASAPVGSCAGPPEPDRSDKPAYVRNMNKTTADGQALCQSNLRAIMTADDEFGATLQLLSDRGALANTLVIFSSDNGLMWGEHGRVSKFVPYEPSIRVPLLLRWPGHIPAGTNTSRTVSYLDLLPTMLQAAAVTLPTNAPRLDGESLLGASTRTTMFSGRFSHNTGVFTNASPDGGYALFHTKGEESATFDAVPTRGGPDASTLPARPTPVNGTTQNESLCGAVACTPWALRRRTAAADTAGRRAA